MVVHQPIHPSVRSSIHPPITLFEETFFLEIEFSTTDIKIFSKTKLYDIDCETELFFSHFLFRDQILRFWYSTNLPTH